MNLAASQKNGAKGGKKNPEASTCHGPGTISSDQEFGDARQGLVSAARSLSWLINSTRTSTIIDQAKIHGIFFSCHTKAIRARAAHTLDHLRSGWYALAPTSYLARRGHLQANVNAGD